MRRYRPNHHSLGFVRGEAYDPRVKEDLDVDLYLRLSKAIDLRYPPDEARGGWKGARTRARREINRRRFEYIGRQARGGGFEGFCLAGEREYVLTEDGDIHGCELIGTSSATSASPATTGRRSARARPRAQFVDATSTPASASARTSATRAR